MSFEKGNNKEALSTLNAALSAVNNGEQTTENMKLRGNIFFTYGKVHNENGNVKEAVQSYQECFKLRMDIDYLGCAEVQKGMADVFKSLQKVSQTQTLLCNAVETCTVHYGTDHRSVATSLHNLCEHLLENLEHYERYEDMIRKLLNEGKRC